MPFLNYLVEQNVITKYHLDEIIPSLEKGESLDDICIRLKIDEQKLRHARSSFYGYPESQTVSTDTPVDVVMNIPEAAARTYKIVPIGVNTVTSALIIGIVDPGNTEALNAIQFMISQENGAHELSVITYGDFQKMITVYAKDLSSSESPTDGVGPEAESAEEDGLILQGKGEDETTTAEKETMKVDAPAVKAFNVIIQNALDGDASDIHIEPTEDQLRVRYRLDGDLFTSLSLPKPMHPAIVARVKILTKTMKLDEKRKPQDGRFFAIMGGRKIDFRVSTMPTFFGEKVVIRILDPEKGAKSIDTLGLLPDQLELLRNSISLPYGMVLVTGPTGSGKSTTIYSMMTEVDKEKKNVVSLEDPIEYNMAGMNQSQVQAEIGYTFANGLRSILRQDPDVILVVEIRDKETAQLAIQAALTGHLVFSTLHTNTAIGAIARLVDMGVDPYLIPPVLRLIISQRLVHRINKDVEPVAIPIQGAVREIIEHEFADFPAEFKQKLPIGKFVYDADREKTGSMRGRVAVFEMVEMTRELEELILKDPTEPTLYKWSREHGMRTVREDAIIKSSQGIVPWSEVHDL